MSEMNRNDDTVYVALGRNTEEGKMTLAWALQNLEARNVCILHVHRPEKLIGSPSSGLEENDRRAIREMERKVLDKSMDDYLNMCGIAGVDATVVHMNRDNVGEGIVELVYQHSIKKLVIGAAANKRYSPGMADVKSRKAKYVRQHAPVSCLFWFVCNDHLVQTGKGDVDYDEEPIEHDYEHGHGSNALFLYREEKQRRREAEEALAKEKEEHAKTKHQRDDFAVERDNAVGLAEELLGKQPEGASSSTNAHVPHQISCEFSVSEIRDATSCFDPSLKIAEGDYGSIYKGLLHHTPVVIKLLHQNTQQGPSEFQQKVEVLDKLRHPNLVTFMGTCPELWALVFEYLPNGSLEDRLSCTDDTSPLSWKTRIRIATELFSVLIFAHSISPRGTAHGHLNSGDILLDENFICKVNNFGIRHNNPEENTTKSDIYSFGILLLQLLTGRSSPSSSLSGIVQVVKAAIDRGNLAALLDTSAGEWPFLQATQLAHLALRCCETDSNSMPELATEVRRVLEPMRASFGGSISSTFQVGSEERRQPPSYFICPILQEVMKDPHVAADGFTYEADALRSWLESGHDTSPMTNVRLQYCTLVPNHSLRSAIQEWQELP